MTTDTRFDLDVEALVELLFAPDRPVVCDPYPTYAAIREQAPVHRSPSLDAWLLTRHDDIVSVLRSPSFSANPGLAARHGEAAGQLALIQRVLLFMDGAEHIRLRRLVNIAFSPVAVERLRGRVEALVTEYLSPLAERRSMELIADLAFPFPVAVICEMLGVPSTDREEFRNQVAKLTALLEWDAEGAAFEDARSAVEYFAMYFMQLFAHRRAAPADDLVSSLLGAELDGDTLDMQDVLVTCMLLLAAGHETTTNFFGNALLALLRNPDQMDLMRQDPTVLQSGIEELFRYDSSVQLTRRVCIEDTIIGGETIRPGDKVVLLLGSANRDPARYAAPDRLDLRRDSSNHIAFGSGPHFCVGAALARLEAEALLPRLLKVLRDPRLESEPEYRPTNTLRSVRALDIAWGA